LGFGRFTLFDNPQDIVTATFKPHVYPAEAERFQFAQLSRTFPPNRPGIAIQ
jgi:hypothetical protein